MKQRQIKEKKLHARHMKAWVKPFQLALSGLLLLALSVGCGSDATPLGVDAAVVSTPGPDAAPTTVLNESKMIKSLDFIEGTFNATPADIIVVTVTAPANFDWNIHGHSAGTTSVIDGKRDVSSISKVFTPSGAGEWFFLMSNKGDAELSVQVEMEIYGTATFAWD